MGGFDSLIVWACATALALPPAPCAVLVGCGRDAQTAKSPVSHSACCQRHSAPTGKPSPERSGVPCSRDCCRAKAVTPGSKGLVIEQAPAVADVSWTPPVEEAAWRPLAPGRPNSTDRSLQILHCSWRC